MALKLSTKEVYRVYDVETRGPHDPPVTTVVAVIDGDSITGSMADIVRRMLLERGWPGRAPDELICGTYFYASREPRVVAGN